MKAEPPSATATGTATGTSLSEGQLAIVDLGAAVAQKFGFARTTGQVYGLLFASPRPLTLDALAEALAISKTSAGSAARQLLGLNAIRQVWLPGERKDHFEVRTELRDVLRDNYHRYLKPPVERAEGRIEGLVAVLDRDLSEGRMEPEACAAAKARLESLRGLHRRLAEVLPLLERLL